MIKRATALTMALAGLSFSSATWAQNPDFRRHTVDDALPGAAFVVPGNIVRGQQTELVVSSFGELAFGPNGPIPPDAGRVTLYYQSSGQSLPLTPIGKAWDTIVIADEEDSITFPNRPTVADVNGDGREDVIIPGGYFFDTYLGNSRGTITWWENRQNGKRWVRHDIITNSPFSFHSVLFDDFTGDGVADMVTVGEAAGNPSDPFDDEIELILIPGEGQGEFGAPMTIGEGGGSLLTAYDVNDDGNLDIVSPQFFGNVAGQPFVPPIGLDNPSVASFVWYENMGDGNFIKHVIGNAQGPGFAIVPVDNLLGDGVTRWIATNHTNQKVTFPPFSLYPEPTVYEFTPGDDSREMWAVRPLSAPGDFPVAGGIGQAAPGFVGAADINDDGRIDLAVSGDGARGVFWMKQKPNGTFDTRQLPGSEGYGQAGGPVILDLTNSGTLDVVFTSFDQNAVSIWAQCDEGSKITSGIFQGVYLDPGCRVD